jgi:hypothetical protein
MFRKTTLALICSGLGALAYSGTAAAGNVDARADAMGGTGVVLGHYYSAPLHNPALLSSYGESDDFALSINAGAGIHGDAEIVEDIDAFTEAFDDLSDALSTVSDMYDDLSANGSGSSYTLDGVEAVQDQAIAAQSAAVAALDNLDGQRIDIDLGASVVVAVPNALLPAALFMKAKGQVIGLTDIDSTDLSQFDLTDLDDLPDVDDLDSNSEAIFLTAITTDVGVTLARAFEMPALGRNAILDFGISPKYQQLAVYHYRANVDSFDDADAFDSEDVVQEGAFNLDAGLMLRYGRWRVGLSGQDLIARELDTNDADDISANAVHYTYQVNPLVTAGAGYYGSWFTVGGDVELTEQSGFEGLDMPQFASLGLELNAFDWAQLRAGYKHDLNEVQEDQVTAGIGLSPFGALHVDVAAQYAADSSVSASLQLAFTF